MSGYVSTFAVHKGGAAMAKNATITLRIEGELKADSEQIFRRLGLTTTEAIKIFLSAVRNRRGIPFPVQLDERRAEGTPLSVDRKAAVDAIIGKYADITPSEEFARIKQAEIDDEGRKLRS
jgi:addiction module RelB/DinJ family antitoxin